jgi:hypothetical protein
MIKQYWKEVAILGLCIFILIMRFGPLQPEPEVLERVQIEYRDRVQVVYKDKIVYREKVITKPDGTRIEERTESREQAKEENKENNKKESVVVVEKHPKPRYTIGVTYDILNAQYNGQIGLRLADLPIFLQASLHGPRWGLGVGFSIELGGN